MYWHSLFSEAGIGQPFFLFLDYFPSVSAGAAVRNFPRSISVFLIFLILVEGKEVEKTSVLGGSVHGYGEGNEIVGG
jgi:hypothetical protein